MASIQVSIVMPVYNGAPLLSTALDSVLNQCDVSLELIAVNDGSTDDSLSVLREAARRDHRIVVIDQPNQGWQARATRGCRPRAASGSRSRTPMTGSRRARSGNGIARPALRAWTC